MMQGLCFGLADKMKKINVTRVLSNGAGVSTTSSKGAGSRPTEPVRELRASSKLYETVTFQTLLKLSNSEIQPYVLDPESDPEAQRDLCTEVTLIQAVSKKTWLLWSIFPPDPFTFFLFFFFQTGSKIT